MHMFYEYDFMCWVWTQKHIMDEMFFFSAISEAHEYLMFVLSDKLWSTWVLDVCVEWEALENMSIWCLCWARSSGAQVFDVFVEREALEHMSILMFVLSEKLYSTWVMKPLCWPWISEAHKKIRIGSVSHKPWGIPSWCWA